MKYRRLKIWLDMITNVDKSKVTKEIWQEHLDVICQNIIKEAKQGVYDHEPTEENKCKHFKIKHLSNFNDEIVYSCCASCCRPFPYEKED